MNNFKKERRKYERYGTEAKVYFSVTYDLKTRVEFQLIHKKEGKKILSKRYPAISKNVSVEAICFSSERKLEKGDNLYLEVYLPNHKEPIHMEGQVRWSHATSIEQKEENKFDTGVKLITVNEKSVLGSVSYDEANKIVWSIVLDSVFGNFSKVMKQRSRQP